MRLVVPLGLLLLAAGCSGSEQTAPKPKEQAPAAAPQAAPTPRPPAPPAKARQVEEKSDFLEFTYGWPAEAAAIPKLNAELEADMAKQRKEALATAREDKEARGADAPYNSHGFSKVWEAFGQNSRLLSLKAEVATFTGGAHGNATSETLLWDKQNEAAIELADLFANAKAAFASMSSVYCQELDRQRAEKREGSEVGEDEDWMTKCPAIYEQAIAPVDSNKDGRFDLLRVFIDPYEAGPYVEGTYEVDVPVTSSLRKLLKPDYAPGF